MEDNRYPKQQLDYRPIGRPLKRLLHEYNRELRTCHYWSNFV